MASKGKHKYRQQWEAFANYLKTGKRPKQFDQAYGVVADKVSGLYEMEARAMWKNIKTIKPKKLVEVGRNLGGSLFLFGCAGTQLEEVLSIDVEHFELTDWELERWFTAHDIYCDCTIQDSTQYEAEGTWDLVFIDGGHTGPTVRADIEVWREHARYIGFHDFADRDGKNRHKRYYADVVNEIKAAAQAYQWQQFGERGRSDIVFKTGVE